uniref:Uncharacterized protein n=1 Tax=viral metagenome TaxID=1070528 RepID=A0A6C0CRG7_9ZZZZ
MNEKNLEYFFTEDSIREYKNKNNDPQRLKIVDKDQLKKAFSNWCDSQTDSNDKKSCHDFVNSPNFEQMEQSILDSYNKVHNQILQTLKELEELTPTSDDTDTDTDTTSHQTGSRIPNVAARDRFKQTGSAAKAVTGLQSKFRQKKQSNVTGFGREPDYYKYQKLKHKYYISGKYRTVYKRHGKYYIKR